MHHLRYLLFFGIPLLYYHNNLNSSIVFCLSCGDIYLSFGFLLLIALVYGSLAGFFLKYL